MYIFSLKMQVIPCIANFLQGIHSFKSRITSNIARDLVNKTKFSRQEKCGKPKSKIGFST